MKRTRILRAERGATAVEYAVIVSLIAAVIMTAVALLGRHSDNAYRCTVDSMVATTDRC